MNEIGNTCYRESAVNCLKSRGKELVFRGQQLLSLANAIEDIEKSAIKGFDGEGRHPHIGIGSDAEEALWELVCSYRG